MRGASVTSDCRFDYIIVGAGTAGCVLAARLSEDRNTRVCLLEAGGPARHPFIRVPALVGAAIAHRGLTWGLHTEPQSALNNRRLPLPRGKVIGGSGSINGMAYHRGHPKDYDDWAAAGNTGWSWHEVLPYFRLSENNADRRDRNVHGIDGAIHVTFIPKPNRLNQAFIDAFAALGEYRHCDDFTGLDPEGYGLRQGTIHRGRRDSSASALLMPALRRPNLSVLTRTAALGIRIEAGRATGVEVPAAGGRRALLASREVLLCAGAIHSPQLLMLSGVGPARHLESLGISVKADLGGVGANYHDHPAVPVALEMRDTTSYGLSWRTLPRAIWNVAQYALARRGPLASNVFESTAFIRSSGGADRPDMQIAFQPARRNPHAFPLPLGHGFAMSVVNLYPRSRGEVRLASSDARVAPRVNPNILADPEDCAPLLRGLQLARRLCDAPAFQPYHATEVRPGRGARSVAELEAYLREATATVHHPVGSCRMGSDATAVVDPTLRVRGIDGLRVVDASIFPSIVGGNTNAPIVMVAEKAVDLITGRTLRGRHGG
ncbi:MAG: GMC family oxidoreductase [Steroidobacteraceae bacterium]